MQTIFNNQTREAFIARIQALHPGITPQWGKMTVFQMVKHNTYWNGWILGTEPHTYKQAFIGKLFGKIGMRKMLKPGTPLDKNIPTSAQFIMKDPDGDLEAEKQKWIALIKAYEQFNNPRFIHDFLGPMTQEQIGVLAYKHTDHHLRQFGI